MAAKKRMFHIGVLGTDFFLDMPHSTQCLYVHSMMRADDDGFVSDMKQIQKLTNTTVDDLAILCAKGYLFEFCTNNLHKVYLLAHWNLCNSVRKDCYAQSEFVHFVQKVHLGENKVYQLHEDQQGLFAQNEVVQMHKNRNETVPQIRSDKIRKDKISICADQFAQFWDLYPKKINKRRAEQEWNKAKLDTKDFEEIMEHLKIRNHTTWVKQNKAFVVYPERFIKYSKWEDDLSEYEPLEEESDQLLDLSKK